MMMSCVDKDMNSLKKVQFDFFWNFLSSSFSSFLLLVDYIDVGWRGHSVADTVSCQFQSHAGSIVHFGLCSDTTTYNNNNKSSPFRTTTFLPLLHPYLPSRPIQRQLHFDLRIPDHGNIYSMRNKQ